MHIHLGMPKAMTDEHGRVKNGWKVGMGTTGGIGITAAVLMTLGSYQSTVDRHDKDIDNAQIMLAEVPVMQEQISKLQEEVKDVKDGVSRVETQMYLNQMELMREIKKQNGSYNYYDHRERVLRENREDATDDSTN